MAQNPAITQLDPPQVIKRIYDEANDSIRVEMGTNSGISIQLDSTTDSISTQGVSSTRKASLTTSSSGVIVPAFSCAGMKSFNLYTITTATLTGAQACTLEISPSDTDDVWIATTTAVTPSGTASTVVMGTAVTNIVARRARVSIASTISSGTFDIYLVVQGL